MPAIMDFLAQKVFIMFSLSRANWYLTTFDCAQPKHDEKIDYFNFYLGHLTNL